MVTKYEIPLLPLRHDLETKAVLKQLAPAHRRLAELKGVSRTIPNEQILINTLTLQEAKDSSAIENIITTHDELFKAELLIERLTSPAAKEVQNYAHSLAVGLNSFAAANSLRKITSSKFKKVWNVIRRVTVEFPELK